MKPSPPTAPRKTHSITCHGIDLDDPYAWLQDSNYPKVDDPKILDYIHAENTYFDTIMQPHKALVDDLFRELKARKPAHDEGVAYHKNGYWYQWRFNPQDQYRRRYRQAGLANQAPHLDSWEVLLDENTLAHGHNYFRLGACCVSPDGCKLAYSIDITGDERYVLHVIDIDSRTPLITPIPNTLGHPVWDSHSDGLLYLELSKQWRPHKVLYRNLKSTQPADVIIYQELDAAFFVNIDLTQSEDYILISSGDHVTHDVRFLPRDNPLASPTLIKPRQTGHEYYVDHQGDYFWIRSNQRHANFDLYQTPVTQLHRWTRKVSGNRQHYLTDHMAFADYLIICERILGLDHIRIIDHQNRSHYIHFPEPVYTVDFEINPHYDTHHLRLAYTSMITPHTVYNYDLTTQKLHTLKVQNVPDYDATQFTSKRLMVPARDGNKVPISIVYHRKTPMDGSAPVYLYGYGAYGHGMPPGFSSNRVALLTRGFIFVIAHIRGGDELGYHWYTQGKLNQRHNTFNDFIDCAHYLIRSGYTQSGRIVISGGSAGGTLIGAAINQAPEIFGAAAAHVPFVDVLNTMLNDELPLTPIEWPEWGNPIEDAEAFNTILSYSPYEQTCKQAYPPLFVTAGLHDPRVTYWEAAKWVAKLRHCQTNHAALILLKTHLGAGHGGVSGRFDALEEVAQEYAFFLTMLGVST